MDRRVAAAFLVALFVGATSPVWAAPLGGNPTFVPDPASPGASVSFNGTITESTFDPSQISCAAYGGPAPTPLRGDCRYDKGRRVRGWFELPKGATPGTTYTITLCGPAACLDSEPPPGAWFLSGAITVAPTPVVVPTLRCEPYAVAASKLATVGLTALERGQDQVVASQRPSAGATVTPPVRVLLEPAMVPSFVSHGLVFSRAEAGSACLTLVRTGADSGVVVGQVPDAGLPVTSDRLATVTVSPTTTSASTTTPTPTPTPTRTPTPTPRPTPDPVTKKVGHWVRHRVPPSLPFAALAGVALVGAREWRVFHRPVVDPAACVVRVGTPFPTTELTYDPAGAPWASYVVVRHDHRPTVEEAP
jgi:hypothetical protein